MNRNEAMRNLVVGGVLPIVIFTLIENYYGTLWGLVAGMAFGIGEITLEYYRHKKVSGVTLFGNGMLLVLGLISLFTGEGIWFKLQPAIIELAFAILLMGSVVIKKPLLNQLAVKQGMWSHVNESMRPVMEAAFGNLTFRLGIFFLLHAALATWAALNWSTSAWALLKGVGFTGSMVLYLILEMVLLRQKVRNTRFGAK